MRAYMYVCIHVCMCVHRRKEEGKETGTRSKGSGEGETFARVSSLRCDESTGNKHTRMAAPGRRNRLDADFAPTHCHTRLPLTILPANSTSLPSRTSGIFVPETQRIPKCYVDSYSYEENSRLYSNATSIF